MSSSYIFKSQLRCLSPVPPLLFIFFLLPLLPRFSSFPYHYYFNTHMSCSLLLLLSFFFNTYRANYNIYLWSTLQVPILFLPLLGFNMNIVSLSVSQQARPLVNFQTGLPMEPFFRHTRKDKVIVILGATGTGKSRLAIDLATCFPPAEIVNSDKMQLYRGLDITTNKVSEEECRGVPHHLLGIADPDSNFTADDFTRHASSAIDSIVHRDCLPIIAGGSNSYIRALVEDDAAFRMKYECCFLWVDVSLPVLDSFLSKRVDRMIEAGQVDEVRQFFDPAGDYTTGIRKAIGVPEFDEFLRTEATADEPTKKRLLENAIAKIRANNCSLARRQLQKIHRLYNKWKRNMYRLDATEVFLKSGDKAEELWENHVLAKSQRIVHKFLYDDSLVVPAASVMSSAPPCPQPKQVAMATASH